MVVSLRLKPAKNGRTAHDEAMSGKVQGIEPIDEFFNSMQRR